MSLYRGATVQDEAGATLNGFTVGDRVKVTRYYDTDGSDDDRSTPRRWLGYDWVTLSSVDPSDKYYPYEVEHPDETDGATWVHEVQHVTVTLDRFAVGTRHVESGAEFTVEAVHPDNTGGVNDPGGDVIVFREADGDIMAMERYQAISDTTPWQEPTPEVFEVGHVYRASAGNFTVTAVDGDGNALRVWENGSVGGVEASFRPKYVDITNGGDFR